MELFFARKSFLILGFLAIFLLGGCYKDIVDATEGYAVQAPFNYRSTGNSFTTRFNDTIFYNADKFFTYKDGDKIYSLPEFKNNKDLIDKIEIYRLFVYIDSISNFDINKPEKFATVQSYIKFANEEKSYRIHYMQNVALKEFYRQSVEFKPYISVLDKETSEAISKRLKSEKPFQLFSYFTDYEGDRNYVEHLDFNITASLRLTLKTK